MDQVTVPALWVVKAPNAKKSRKIAERRGRTREYLAHLAAEEAELEKRMRENVCERARFKDFRVEGIFTNRARGLVLCVTRIADYMTFVLKCQRKSNFPCEKTRANAIFEKKLHLAVDCMFIINAEIAFQDEHFLYLGMPPARWGDLFRFTYEYRISETTLKYVAAQLIIGIEYLHACRIIHRGLKPANFLLFSDLYIKIGDLSHAKKVTDRTYSYVGTAEYVAPEIETSHGYGRSVDWWSLGVSLYEILYRRHPFHVDETDTAWSIAAKRRWALTFPLGNPKSSVNKFLRKLLSERPSARLGTFAGGVMDVKNHRWFSDICFFDLIDRDVVFSTDIVRPRLGRTPETSSESDEDDSSSEASDEWHDFEDY